MVTEQELKNAARQTAVTAAELIMPASSPKEEWASLKLYLELAEDTRKRVDALMKDLWTAVRERNPDAFSAYEQELEHTASELIAAWAYVAATAGISYD